MKANKVLKSNNQPQESPKKDSNLLKRIESLLTSKRFILSCIGLNTFLVGVVLIVSFNINNDLTKHFRTVEVGKQGDILVQERISGGYYVIDEGCLKGLDKPKDTQTFNPATTILDNLGGVSVEPK